MNARTSRTLVVALVLGSLVAIQAAPAAARPVPTVARRGGLPLGPLKVELRDLAPKVKFDAKARLAKGKASIRLSARITALGKTFTVRVLDMGLAKGSKSVSVKRKIGKLRVSLAVSWQGERTILISGTARTMKFKVPVPKLRIRL